LFLNIVYFKHCRSTGYRSYLSVFLNQFIIRSSTWFNTSWTDSWIINQSRPEAHFSSRFIQPTIQSNSKSFSIIWSDGTTYAPAHSWSSPATMTPATSKSLPTSESEQSASSPRATACTSTQSLSDPTYQSTTATLTLTQSGEYSRASSTSVAPYPSQGTATQADAQRYRSPLRQETAPSSCPASRSSTVSRLTMQPLQNWARRVRPSLAFSTSAGLATIWAGSWQPFQRPTWRRASRRFQMTSAVFKWHEQATASATLGRSAKMIIYLFISDWLFLLALISWNWK